MGWRFDEYAPVGVDVSARLPSRRTTATRGPTRRATAHCSIGWASAPAPPTSTSPATRLPDLPHQIADGPPETQLREEYSTYRWILEGMLHRAGLVVESSEARDPIYAHYLCRRRKVARAHN